MARLEPARPAERTIDWEALARGLVDLRQEIVAGLGAADLRHLRRIARWGRLAEALGYATAWLLPNPLSVVLLS